MNNYKNYTVSGENLRLKKCENPECPRLTSAYYCCNGCGLAHEGKYEIHESGMLGHSETCNQRNEERKNLKL